MILGKAQGCRRGFLGREGTKAVITVPGISMTRNGKRPSRLAKSRRWKWFASSTSNSRGFSV